MFLEIQIPSILKFKVRDKLWGQMRKRHEIESHEETAQMLTASPTPPVCTPLLLSSFGKTLHW